MCVCVRVCVCCVHVCVCCVHVCLHVCMCACVCVRVRMHVCCVCVCVGDQLQLEVERRTELGSGSSLLGDTLREETAGAPWSSCSCKVGASAPGILGLVGPEGLQPDAWVCVSHAEPSTSLAEPGRTGLQTSRPLACAEGRGEHASWGAEGGEGSAEVLALQGNPGGGGPAAELGTVAGVGQDGEEEAASRAPGPLERSHLAARVTQGHQLGGV